MKIGVKLTSELIYVLIYVMVAKLLKSSMKIIIFFICGATSSTEYCSTDLAELIKSKLQFKPSNWSFAFIFSLL